MIIKTQTGAHEQIPHITVFTALHGMQMWSSNEISVCLSVQLSVKCVHCDKTDEKLSRFLYHAKDHSV